VEGILRRIQIRHRNSPVSRAAKAPAEQLAGLVERAAHPPLERIHGLVGEVDVLLGDLGRELVIAVTDQRHRAALTDLAHGEDRCERAAQRVRRQVRDRLTAVGLQQLVGAFDGRIEDRLANVVGRVAPPVARAEDRIARSEGKFAR
jgi:hypothetical protein